METLGEVSTDLVRLPVDSGQLVQSADGSQVHSDLEYTHLQNVLEYTGIYWNTLEYTGIGWNILEYAGIFWNILEYSLIWNVQLLNI